MTRQRNAHLVRRLQYFEAVARIGSISKASVELGVSPSAISHQLADLRRTIGEELFERRGRGLILTEAGELLAARLATAFEILDRSISDAIGESERKILKVAACSSFGPYWLIPKISEFKISNPDIDIDFRLYAEDPELTQATADCIVTAQDVKPGYESVDLFEERSFAVAARGLPIGTDLRTVPLITIDSEEPDFAADWKAYAAVVEPALDISKDQEWVRCSHYILAMEAAKAGLGVALLPDFLTASALDAGQLVDLGWGEFNHEDRFYRLCFKEARKNEPELRAFVAWLKRSTQRQTRQLAE